MQIQKYFYASAECKTEPCIYLNFYLGIFWILTSFLILSQAGQIFHICYLIVGSTKENTQLKMSSVEPFTWGKAVQMLKNFWNKQYHCQVHMQTVRELTYVSSSLQAEPLNCWNDPSTEDKLSFSEAHLDKGYKIWVDNIINHCCHHWWKMDPKQASVLQSRKHGQNKWGPDMIYCD